MSNPDPRDVFNLNLTERLVVRKGTGSCEGTVVVMRQLLRPRPLHPDQQVWSDHICEHVGATVCALHVIPRLDLHPSTKRSLLLSANRHYRDLEQLQDQRDRTITMNKDRPK